MESSLEWTLSARWVFPVDRPPMPEAVVTIRGDRIVAVEPPASRKADCDLGNCALLPGLVNAHVHLDLSGLRGQCTPSEDFIGWLGRVIEHRRSLNADQVRADIQKGLEECRRSGTTLVGDISSEGLSWEILSAAPIRAVVFHELLGLTAERATSAWARAQNWLDGCPPNPTCRPGLSPHAPYSVNRWLFHTVGGKAQKNPVPVAVHLAETPAEKDLLSHHRGPLVDFLKRLGVWEPAGLLDSHAQLVDMYRDLDPVLWVHGNDLDVPLHPGQTLVHCPRTHAAFGRPIFRPLMRSGGRIALGTDSLGSNPDLDLLAEIRFLHGQFPEIPGETLLRMGTLDGARALGWDREAGSLKPGKSADLAVVPLPPTDDPDPHRMLLETDLPVKGVLFRGQWQFPP